VPLVREVIQEWEGSASRAKKIAASLLAAMAAGQPAILHDLPGSGELAVQWGVPQPTVSAAKKLIAAYGVIKLTPNGKRYYVARHVSADSLIAAADAKLSTAQAAAEAGVSKRTIVRWAEEGRLPATLTAGGHRASTGPTWDPRAARPPARSSRPAASTRPSSARPRPRSTSSSTTST
jgi:excisionase family DNA binding protein